MPDKNSKDPIKKALKKIKAASDATRFTLTPVKASPDERLGELFAAVQLARVHTDGMTFVNLVPNKNLRKIVQEYKTQSAKPDFDLSAFVKSHFQEYRQATDEALTEHDDPEQHIIALWDKLTRQATEAKGSLIPLPNPYIVPGGRFQEQFYWDSYFIMLGLEASGRHDLTDGIMSNFVHMFHKFGFILTGNRTYYTSRSQPPYFLQMIRLVAHRRGHNRYLLPRLPYLMQEYLFWTQDTKAFLTMSRKRYKRVVRMPDGNALHRYYDAKDTPRPESYKEDVEAAEGSDNLAATYRHLRAAAESGWDFSSRWLADPNDLGTIRTTEIVPIDLNCLLYELELALAEAHKKLLQLPIAKYYEKKAKKRRDTINAYLWDEELGYYFDYHSPTEKHSGVWSIAGMYALYCGVATPEQAQRVVDNIKSKFLEPGGVNITLHDTGQQWDSPNGWAPMEWVTIIGLRRYGFDELADKIKTRWLAANQALFHNEHKFVEKYDVTDPTSLGGGGEYELQDGFGWTNGVFIALKRDLDVKLANKIKLV
jgi:alpha,alpha-trehalase